MDTEMRIHKIVSVTTKIFPPTILSSRAFAKQMAGFWPMVCNLSNPVLENEIQALRVDSSLVTDSGPVPTWEKFHVINTFVV